MMCIREISVQNVPERGENAPSGHFERYMVDLCSKQVKRAFWSV